MAWMVQNLRQSWNSMMPYMSSQPDVTVLNDPPGMKNALSIASALRRNGITCEMIYGGKIKNNMKKCDGWFVVICEGEVVKLRNPRNYLTEEAPKDDVIHSLVDHFNNDYTDFTPLIEKIVCDAKWYENYFAIFPHERPTDDPSS